MLKALASLHPMALTRAQVGGLAKVKRTGGTFGTYLSMLRQAGYIDEDGKRVTLTQSGLDALGVDIPPPATTEEIIAMWSDRFPAGARSMVNVLVAGYPEWFDRQELGERAGLTTSGGTFGTYLSMLRTAELIEENDGLVRAGGVLYTAEAQA